MTTLPNFPLLNQLADTHEANAQFDCVPTCIAACLQYLLKKPFDGAAIKDVVYGAGYQGGTAAAEYVQYCHEQGVLLFPMDGTSGQLIADVKAQLAEGHPLIATEPDPYAKPSLGWTHVIAFYGDDPAGTLTALDPYGGHPVTLSEAEWQSRLQFNQVWAFERIGGIMGIPAGWHDDGTVLYCPSHVQNGPEIHITGPFRDYVLNNAWRPSDRFVEAGHHVEVMQYNDPALGSGFIQTSLWSMLLMPDSGASAGKVIYAWIGVEEAHLRGQYEAQLAEIAALQAELAKPVLDTNAVANRLTSLAQLGHQIESVANLPL